MVETNTFSATTIAMADYHLEEVVYDLNFASAKIAREAADEAMIRDPKRPRFVAGAIGPTNRTASLSPDVNDPSIRNVNFDQLVKAYYEQIKALVDGGVDLLLPETTFDTLNLKAAIFAWKTFSMITANAFQLSYPSPLQMHPDDLIWSKLRRLVGIQLHMQNR